MNGVPEGVRRLAEERAQARADRDFTAADRLREQIRRFGFEVVDGPEGWRLDPRFGEAEPAERAVVSGSLNPVRPQDVPSRLDEPPTADVSLQWLIEGWPEDVARGISSFDRGRGSLEVQHVVVDVSGEPFPQLPASAEVETVRLVEGTGWAAARNAGMRRSAGRLVVVLDGSVEASGDALSPLVKALEDPTVGVTGPFGIVTDDLHEFRDSPGPDVDAVQAYLMAFRRDLLAEGVAFDEKLKFYRSADIELSFQVKDRGLRATVTSLPVERHEHRMWMHTPEEKRARLSKRNLYRFLDLWRGRTDLLVANSGEAHREENPSSSGER
jgi:hypothetical protein